MGENFQGNLRIADEIQAVAAEAGATLAQVAIAWLLRGDDIAPIPGTKRVARVEENTAADGIELTPEHIAKLDDLIPPAGTTITKHRCGWSTDDHHLTDDELTTIEAAEELQIASRRADGSLRRHDHVIVRHDDGLDLRSVKGPAGAWYGGTRGQNERHITAVGIDKDVTLNHADPSINEPATPPTDRSTHRYRRTPSTASPATRPATTIRLLPRA